MEEKVYSVNDLPGLKFQHCRTEAMTYTIVKAKPWTTVIQWEDHKGTQQATHNTNDVLSFLNTGVWVEPKSSKIS
jgi:inorganic pyrophosphatase